MARKVMNAGLPVGTFLAMLVLGIFAAPSMGVISARIRLLSSSDPFVCPDLVLDQPSRMRAGQDMPGGFSAAEGDPYVTSVFADSQAGMSVHGGKVRHETMDMASSALSGFSLTREYFSLGHGVGSYGSNALGGRWKVAEWPHVDEEFWNNNLYALVMVGARRSATFYNSNGTFYPQHFLRQSMTESGSTRTLTDTRGNRTAYYSNSGAFPGAVTSFTDRAGNTTTYTRGTVGTGTGVVLEVVRSWTTAGNTYTESWLYTYASSGSFSGLMTQAELRRRVNAGVWTAVRKTDYSYHLTSANGPDRSLARAVVKDPSGSEISTSYYRYYTSGAGNSGQLKSATEGTAYARLRQAVGGTDALVDSASDTTVANYAQRVLSYDSDARISSQTLLGAGCGCGGAGGKGTFTYSYLVNTNCSDYNVWQRRCIETLPDGNQSIVYTNWAGQPMLSSFKLTSNGSEWKTYHQYSSNGTRTATAYPSAVTGYSEENSGLVTSGDLSTSSGYWEGMDYVTSGSGIGYLKAAKSRQGSSGSWITKSEMAYTTRVGSVTTYPVSSRTVYENTNLTGGRTTSHSYTWHGTTNQEASRVTTYPAVTTAKNGSNSSTTTDERCDVYGRVLGSKDQDGFYVQREYDPATGALTKEYRDVNSSTLSNPWGWTTPSGGGLHLLTEYRPDALGRTTKVTDPNGNVTFTVYRDPQHEVRTYPGWTGSATTGPTQVSREDWALGYSETLTMTATPATSGSEPTGTESISGVESLSRTFVDNGDRPTHTDSYFSFSGLSYTTSTSLGTLGIHFYRSKVNYDSRGRNDRSEDWTGTITRTVYDGRSRASSTWVGTDDTPTSGDWSPSNTTGTNLIKVSESIYDSGGVGDDLLTASRQYTASGTYLETTYAYDFRHRQTATRGPDGVAQVSEYDNLDRVVTSSTYADQSGPMTFLASELRAKSETRFDERGQVYQTIRHHVQQSTDGSPGTVGNRLTSNTWYNARGMTIKTKDPNGVFSKTVYDGAGRTVSSFTSYHDAETAYSDADDVTGDTVISESVTSYDAGSRVIQTTSYQRTSSTAKTGALSSSWAVGDSRRTFTASWYDVANRLTHTVDYGNNGDAAFTRPSTPPATPSSDTTYTYIRSETQFNAAGRAYRRIDNKGRITHTTFDMLSRATKVIENYVDGTVGNAEYDTDRTTETVYDSVGRMSERKVHNPKGASVEVQTTTYVYGTDANVASPEVSRNDLLVAEIYPDSDDTYNAAGAAGSKLANGTDGTYDRVEYQYDYASRKKLWKLQLGTQHDYSYDASGRLFKDAVSTLGEGIDGAVLRIETTFDDLSRSWTIGSYSAVSGGTLLNEIRYTYDGWGNESNCEQGHEGTATGAPSYTKTFADGAVSGEAKFVRLTQMTYPNGRIVYRNYPSSGTVGDRLSRVDNIAHDASGVTKFAQYTYLGAGAIVKIAHPQVSGGFNLDYGTSGSPSGWDRFGRIIDQKWQNDSAAVKDQWQYAYDRTGNRMYRDNLTATGKDQKWTYDGVDRVTLDKRGDLNVGKTDISGTPAFQETWTLEGTGNWKQLVQAASGTTTLDQTRTSTKANETTTISATTGTDWGDGEVDLNGQMIRVPKPSSLNQRYRLTYDAWRRLVKVVDDELPNLTVAEYKYDGLHRRIVKLIPRYLLTLILDWDRRDYYYSCEWQIVEERELLDTNSKTTVATTPKYQYVWDARYLDAAALRDENKDADNDCVDGSDERLYYAQDVNANVTALLDTSGTVVERVLYDAYGKHALFQSDWTTSQASTIYANEILFASYRLNPETGMYQVRHREYHPALGRWVQRDPVGYHDGMNLYEYVRSNPLIGLDAQGLFTFTGNSSDSLGIRPGTASAPFGAARYGYTLMNFAGQGFVWGTAATTAPQPTQADPANPQGALLRNAVWMWDVTLGKSGSAWARSMKQANNPRNGFLVPLENVISTQSVVNAIKQQTNAGGGRSCISDLSMLWHAGGGPGVSTFNPKGFSGETDEGFNVSTGPYRFHPKNDGENTAKSDNWYNLGRALKQVLCEKDCSISIYSCRFAFGDRGKEGLRDLAFGSGCTTYGAGASVIAGSGGWALHPDKGSLFIGSMDSEGKYKSGHNPPVVNSLIVNPDNSFDVFDKHNLSTKPMSHFVR